MLGTDNPYVTERGTQLNIAHLHALGLPQADLRAIERDNALRLLPSLARG